MIKFTDPRLYLMGVGSAMLMDDDGKVVYYSDKFQDSNVSTSSNNVEVRAGTGNGLATILASDSSLTVELTAADFDLAAKGAQVGSAVSYNAPTMVSQDVTASGTSISIDPSVGGTPIAALGYNDIFCWVQEVGEPSPVAVGGIPYPLDALTGAISGFAAQSGHTYRVWYTVNKATSQILPISSFINPSVLHAQMAWNVYKNMTGGKQSGTRVGTLYVIIPALRLGGDGGLSGGQTSNATTSVSGTALAFDEAVVPASANECASSGSIYAYYVYVPCDGSSESITGVIAKIGGLIEVEQSSSYQVAPMFVMENGQLVPVTDFSTDFTYTLTGAPTGTSVSSSGVISTGSTAGDCEMTVEYDNGGETLSSVVNVSVTA